LEKDRVVTEHRSHWVGIVFLCSRLNRKVLYTNIDRTLVNSLHRLLNCEIGGLDCRVSTTEYRTRVHCIHMYHLFCDALVCVIYSEVSGQCSQTMILIEATYHRGGTFR